MFKKPHPGPETNLRSMRYVPGGTGVPNRICSVMKSKSESAVLRVTIFMRLSARTIAGATAKARMLPRKCRLFTSFSVKSGGAGFPLSARTRLRRRRVKTTPSESPPQRPTSRATVSPPNRACTATGVRRHRFVVSERFVNERLTVLSWGRKSRK